MSTKKIIKTHTAQLTSISDKKAVDVEIEDLARLREIRALVEANNQSSLPTELVICQIYMESRFDKNARSDGSSARGLMQLLRAPIRELYRLENLKKPSRERRREADLYREADEFHDSAQILDEATNIRVGTAYMRALIEKRTAAHATDPVSEAYKDYRGVRNGIYYSKIKAAAERLKAAPESMQVLRDMVK
ncbi:lytic transglycosylase domain-containing protein [Massilia sp. TW-1]|uniref:Lytic transglycosylase domain-containing protein n=1 Tax=Telluria antibiotica TaxID=2717319 RepID=A0ABX0PMA0_9BURK|nr:transglycosylase SLT domain-containing protein [Telluria antibiotica]NIA57629.1 lytic transglycosylase domain-containing protein [Telluria antibiotica]